MQSIKLYENVGPYRRRAVSAVYKGGHRASREGHIGHAQIPLRPHSRHAEIRIDL